MQTTAESLVTSLARQPIKVARQVKTKRWSYTHSFIVLQFTLQIATLIGVLSPLRTYFRVSSFSVSLLMLFVVKGRLKLHPSAGAIKWVLIILMIAIWNPQTIGVIPGLAALALYFAIVAPVWWAGRAATNLVQLRSIVILFWLFHSVSAGVGVIQAYFPGRFQPVLSSVIAAQGESYIDSLYLITSDGSRILRPMGLTDMPGGAGISGFYAVLFGSGILLTSHRQLSLKTLAVISIGTGVTALYLCQIRSLLIMLVISLCSFLYLLIRHEQVASFLKISALLLLAFGSAALIATAIAGDAVWKRWAEFSENGISQSYYSNRGIFLEDAIYQQLPKYPFGAGLGRWGMINNVFADHSQISSDPLWAEIQWTAWLYDGGLPLILAYSIAVLIALRMSVRIAWRSNAGQLWIWGAVLLGYNVAAFCLTFNYPLFIGQLGMEFWMFNAILYSVSQSELKKVFQKALL